MKLRTKTTIYFLLMMALLFAATGWFVYSGIKNVVAEETDEGLYQEWKFMEPFLERANDPATLEMAEVRIEPLARFRGKTQYIFRDTLLEENEDHPGPQHGGNDEDAAELETYRTLEVQTNLSGKGYRVTLLKSAVDAEDLQETILKIFAITFLVFLIGTLIFQWVVAARLWKPFHQMLKEINKFSLTDPKPMKVVEPSTQEFQQLGSFLENMTTKVRSDYQNLKSFTENASHELQTPLAVIRTNLERLLQSDSLKEPDAQLAASALESLQGLTRLNAGLLLLSKIENRQFSETESQDLLAVIDAELTAQRELFELKGIEVVEHFDAPIEKQMHPVLAEVMVRNLLSNAIRHNQHGGKIEIHSKANTLIFSNTGSKEAIPLKTLFVRFGKASASGNSPGLGLSIIKEICNLYDWTVSYRFENNLHVFAVSFA